MASLTKSIVVAAAPEKVWAYSQEPANLPKFWPGIEDVSDVEWLPNGGTRCRFGVRFAGIRLNMVSEDLEVVPLQRVLNRTSGGLDSTVTWLFAPVEGGTRVTVGSEYTVPIPVLGKMAEALVVKANEKDAEKMLANLKAQVEATAG